MLIAGVVVLVFAALGLRLLETLQISLVAFRLAGGVLLLLQATNMIMVHQEGLATLTPGERREALAPGDIAVFPLAFPLIAGPATLTAVVLLMGRTEGDLAACAVVTACIFALLAITYVCMISTEVLQSVLKTTGTNVVARLSGLILAALAAQYILDGVRGARLFAA